MDDTKFSATTVHLDHITTALNCLAPFGGNFDESGSNNNANKTSGGDGLTIGSGNGGGSSKNTNDDVMVYIDRDGLSFIRDFGSAIRIQLLLSRELFVSYAYRNISNDEEETEDEENDCMKLCIKLGHLLDTISVVNKNQDDVIECTMNYDGYGSVFALILQDSFVEEKVTYSTYLFNEALRDKDAELLQLHRDSVIFECILKGDILYNALKDLKELNARECYLYGKASSNDMGNIFALIAKSDLGYSKIILPNNRNIIEKLEVMDPTQDSDLLFDTPIIAYFDFNRFDKIRLSCKIASKVLLRLDTNGILGVNILSQTNNIIVSNKDQTSPKKSPQLPIDYPGIVIEITMLTKDELDSIAKQDIETLMDVTLNSKSKSSTGYNNDLYGNGNVKKPHLPATEQYLHPMDNLLQLSKSTGVLDNIINDDNNESEAETEDENMVSSSRQVDTSEFPFF